MLLTRVTAYNNIVNYIDKELEPLAKCNGITVIGKSGKINKGWKGLLIEKLAGVNPNNRKAPNGLNFEIKSVCYVNRHNVWEPKETMAITMVDSEDILKNEFFKSHLWEKIKSIIFCAVSWHKQNSTKSKILKVMTFDFLKDENLIYSIKNDYDFIRDKISKHGLRTLESRDGSLIQTRTKGLGHGSISRAFYAKKNLLNKICPPFN